MKNKFFRKMMALVAITSLSVSQMNMPVNAQGIEEEATQFVIMTETQEDMETVLDEVEGELLDDTVAVVEMNSQQEGSLADDEGVKYIEEDVIFTGSDFEDADFNEDFGTDFTTDFDKKMYLKQIRAEQQNVPLDEQWNIDAVRADSENEVSGCDAQIKVAVLDSGITVSEDIDVTGRVNLVPGEEDVAPWFEDLSGHGTAVASIIASKNNEIGVTGINPNVALYSVKVLDDNNQAPLSRIVEGIRWCIDNDIDIINMSFGVDTSSQILREVLDEAYENNILLVAAAGNKGYNENGNVQYPAAYENVIAVGGTDENGQLSDISSVGDEIELLAPGESVPVSDCWNEIVCADGTSMAAAHVTGIASKLWEKNPDQTNDFIRQLLQASANEVSCEAVADRGLVDLSYATEVYDAFEAVYEEDASNVTISENNAEIESYEDVVANASWSRDNHANAVNTSEDISANAKSIIAIGVRLPDERLKYNADADKDYRNGCFHGLLNSVRDYIHLYNVARVCYRSGWNAALSWANTNIPSDRNGMQLKNGLNTLTNNWNTILSGHTVNDLNKARVILGIAVHTSMDMYAHRSYKVDGTTISFIEGSNADNISYVPSRYTTAKNVAWDIIYVWHYNLTAECIEFYQPDSHSANKFKIKEFGQYCNAADPTNYADLATWFNNRSYTP